MNKRKKAKIKAVKKKPSRSEAMKKSWKKRKAAQKAEPPKARVARRLKNRDESIVAALPPETPAPPPPKPPTAFEVKVANYSMVKRDLEDMQSQYERMAQSRTRLDEDMTRLRTEIRIVTDRLGRFDLHSNNV